MSNIPKPFLRKENRPKTSKGQTVRQKDSPTDRQFYLL